MGKENRRELVEWNRRVSGARDRRVRHEMKKRCEKEKKKGIGRKTMKKGNSGEWEGNGRGSGRECGRTEGCIEVNKIILYIRS